MTVSRDIQEIISKLSSDKAKSRDEGIKLLSTWLESERSTSFCRYIGNKTSKLKPNDISHTETWPFLITLLIQSASLEISTSKRRLPKLIYAKSLRLAAQGAEDSKFSGKRLPLLSVIKSLFNHIFEVLNNVPCFQSEYGVVLRLLLPVKDYCFQMRKPVYCNLVRLYLEKVETSLNDDNIDQHLSKEEVFRCILTLHSLLQNPPSDYPDNLRKDIVKGFSGILSCIRDEGKAARKLIECVNIYLSNDGPNLGCRSFEIHDAAQKFVFRIWLSTRDRVLKDAIVLYARLQLNLVRGAADGSYLIEQLLDVVCKDLDQHSTSGMNRVDVTRDEKLGVLSCADCGLVELSALLFYKACLYMTRAPSTEKRIKRENSAGFLREALVCGKWLWNASFCCLLRNYHHGMSKDLLLYWFEGIYSSFERIMNDASAERSYDGFLWTLRSLHELSAVLLPCNLDKLSIPPLMLDKFTSGWQLIWNFLAHGLAVFSNIAAVADAALLLLGRITANDVMNTYAVAQDFWDLGLFKRKPSLSVLYFVSSYFSRGCSQGDLQEVLHIRKNLLGVILSQTIWKEHSMLNEQMVLFLPAAVYALSTGCVPLSKCYDGLPLSYTHQNISHTCDKMVKMEDQVQQNVDEIFDYSVEVLAKFDGDLILEVSLLQSHPCVRLPREISGKLLHYMEILVLGSLEDDKIRERPLSDLFYVCALLSNLLYGSSFTTKRDDLPFQSSLRRNLILTLECAISSIQKSHDFRSSSCISDDVTDGTSSLFSSLRCFISSPFLNKLLDHEGVNNCQSYAIVQSLERLLEAFCSWYEECSKHELDVKSEVTLPDLTGNDLVAESSCSNGNSRSRIIDMELDVDDDPRDVDVLTPSGKFATNNDSFFGERRKMEMISMISCFFSVLHGATWNILFELTQKESDSKVQGKILLYLCQHPYWSASAKLAELVKSIHSMVKMQVTLKLDCVETLAVIRRLIASLLSMDVCKDKFCGLSTEKESEQSLLSLGNIVNEIAEVDVLDWSGRLKLVDCICDFILLIPQVGQMMIGKLLLMLQDPDYRVRLFLGRRIDVLFKTWDGHEELFFDICSNFGVPLVVCSKGKLVTAKEVLSGGPYPQTTMETIITTLMHLAFHSEKIELEAVFMMSVVAAIDPCHRELVCAALDNLSRHLQYGSRMKYLEELMGSLLFCWVACGVSLVALTEIRQYFVVDAEPSYFIQYCCHWLLPALLVHEDSSHLTWVSKVTCQPLTVLVKNYFVPIFSICLALHCSQNPISDRGTFALQNLVQKFAGLSEGERDKLIKRHMVAIVSCILTLSSCLQEPALPFFSRDTVYRAIQTVVDGFLEMVDCRSNVGVVDKINVFRHDRIFMLLLGIHHKISGASHHRHKRNHLAGVKVLIDVLGHRAASSSTFNYVFNLIGQLIITDTLQEQCFEIISELLRIYKINPSEDVTDLLGEQLQCLVSNLVACCNPSEVKGDSSGSISSKAFSLLLELTVNSDSSLHDYVRELEPFPELEFFDEIRKFHEKISGVYSVRDNLLKFAKRSCYLPSKLLLQSLKALHNKLIIDKGSWREVNVDGLFEGKYWHGDHEIIGAVWLLVRICGSNDTSSVRQLVSDFVSRVGVGDPHCVVFHLFGDADQINFRGVDTDNGIEVFSDTRTSLPEKTLISLLRILKKYLMDDSVNIIDVTSQALRGILSTERGQRALPSFRSYEKSLIEVHSKGVDIELVTKFLLDLDKKFKAGAILWDMSEVWMTRDKTFETWICPLVHSLIGYCSDVVLRLCQDIVLLKAEVAELLLPSVVVDLARRRDMDVNFHELISSQVQKHVFVESNQLIKSIQVWLNCLNELRICYVMEKSCFLSLKRESSKTRPSIQSSKYRAASMKSRGSASSSAWETSTSSWEKVYWLSLDYLHVAKSAVVSGSYFTSMMYVEYWCEEHFKGLTLGSPDFSHIEMLSPHIQILVSAVTKINEPDSLYGILQSYKLTTQIINFEHEGNWGKALEYYDLQVRSDVFRQEESRCRTSSLAPCQVSNHKSLPRREDEMRLIKSQKGLIRSLQQIGCMHLLDFYCQGLTSMKGQMQQDLEFTELQYEAAWRAGNWEFSLPYVGTISSSSQKVECDSFNQNLHSCLRALHEGGSVDFHKILKDSKQELVCSISHASDQSTENIYSTIIKLQIFYHLGMAWDIRWGKSETGLSQPTNPSMDQLSRLNEDWCSILERIQLHMNLLEPFVAFRRVLLQVLGCRDSILQHLLQSASTLRKGSRFSQAAAALHEYNLLSVESKGENSPSYWLGRLEEAKLLRAQGQHEMAISLAKYISEDSRFTEEGSDVFRLVGKWLAETRSSNSRTILEKYLKPAVSLAEDRKPTDKKAMERRSQTHFQLAHYADALFRSHEERLSSNAWLSAMRLRKHKTMELEALVKRLKSSIKGDKSDYSAKILELQRQLAIDKEEAQKLQDDRDNFLLLALEGYKQCLVIGQKYDVRVVFRLVSLWFILSCREDVVNSMLSTIENVQSYKFVPLVYQIASRMGSTKDPRGPNSFQFALVSLVKKMAIEHPYHTVFQLLALANGDRIKDKQRSRSSFVVDVDKKLAAENLLKELSTYHGDIMCQMRRMVEIYIKLAELETRREDTGKKVMLPRELRNLPPLELVPVVTASIPVDHSCQYLEGSFPYFKGLTDSITVMNGINAPKVVECLGSDGHKYRQLAKSGNDDLRQDAVMEQFFGLVNTFLRTRQDTWKRRLGVRTYKVVPFTPSAGVVEWVDNTLPLGEYLIGSMRNGGAHGRYGQGDWSFLKCREHMANERDKRKSFKEVSKNFRPVMHYFFLERFLQPADWFEKRLAYTRSVAASSMVGYIVGLGDRHSMNILIDETTAEVVHIDLGVAFEQGLMLKTPERVPFRLTRDIVDGMGVAGVEGVFRRCCEETLSVMRTNKEALLTIIEVFIHDPLYKWALSPLKALQRQKETEDDLVTNLEDSQDEYEGNKDGARALLRVKQKLDGYEGGEMRSLKGQVQQLIQDAIDPERLCHMFPGWGAWL